MLKDHSMAIFQLHVHVQRIVRRMSRAVLSPRRSQSGDSFDSPRRAQMQMGGDSFDSPNSLPIRIHGSDQMDSPEVPAKQLEVPKK